MLHPIQSQDEEKFASLVTAFYQSKAALHLIEPEKIRRTLQLLAAGLDVPPLDIIPEDHVLTRSFYLLQGFPGRYTSSDLWVEAPPPDAGDLQEGQAFRPLNEGGCSLVRS